MASLPAALAKAVSQLGDPAIMRVLIKTIVITLVVFGIAGLGLIFAVRAVSGQVEVGVDEQFLTILAILAAILGGWLLFRVVALAVVQFFADDIVGAVEAKHYPARSRQRVNLSWHEEMGQSVRAAGRALGVNLLALIAAIPLLFTAIGPAVVFWIANGWLLGRELQDMVWLRHRKSADEPAPLGGLECFALGGIITALLAIPFINLLAPIIGAASATHLVHDRLDQAQNLSEIK